MAFRKAVHWSAIVKKASPDVNDDKPLFSSSYYMEKGGFMMSRKTMWTTGDQQQSLWLALIAMVFVSGRTECHAARGTERH